MELLYPLLETSSGQTLNFRWQAAAPRHFNRYSNLLKTCLAHRVHIQTNELNNANLTYKFDTSEPVQKYISVFCNLLLPNIQ
jgi:hypothetical protein